MSPLCLLLLHPLLGMVLSASGTTLPNQRTNGGQLPGVSPLPKQCTTVNSTYVDCSHRSLKSVPPNIPDTVETLDLSHNTIHLIDEDSFRGLKNLVTLLLDYNSVSKLKAEFFRDQGRLRHLILNHNQVGKLPDDVFIHTPSIEVLDLSYMNNGLMKIPGALHNMTKLSVLKFRSNRLQSATFGPNMRFPALQLLDLGKNQISSLLNDDFIALTNVSLICLNLTENPIQFINASVFHPLRSIEEIDFSEGLDPSIIPEVASALSNVHVHAVYLRNIGLDIWDGDFFKNLQNSSIEVLDLSSNNISALNSYFTGLANLTTLSFRNNSISDVTDTAFSGLGMLQFLDLSRNSLSTIRSGMFESLATTPLKTLLLNRSKIARLDDVDAFRGLSNLTLLKLAKNKINQRLTGEELRGLDSLEELDLGLQGKANLSMSSDAFLYVPQLKVLYLNLINLKNLTVKPSPFTNLKKLEKLDLSNNNMAAVDVDIFSNLSNLHTLYLQHNNLYNMWNVTIHVPFLKSLYNLTYLDLCYNGFQNIPNNTLRNLRELDSLYLCHNKINNFEDNLFKGLNITTLDLAYNEINIVNRTLLEPIQGTLETLYISNNPFSCDCDLRWFKNWLDNTETHVADLKRSKCSSPPSMRGTYLKDFNPERLNCDHRLPLYAWVLIGVATGTLISTVLLAVRFRWYIKYYYYLINAKRRKYIRLEGDDKEFKYDAFVSFCHKDQEWVRYRPVVITNQDFQTQLSITVMNLCQTRETDYIVLFNLETTTCYNAKKGVCFYLCVTFSMTCPMLAC